MGFGRGSPSGSGRRTVALGEPQRALRGHRPEQALQSHLDVFPPGQRSLEFQPQPWVAGVLADGLEPDGEQVVGFKTVRQHARYPRLRLELKTALSWREDVEVALERLLGSMSPER